MNQQEWAQEYNSLQPFDVPDPYHSGTGSHGENSVNYAAIPAYNQFLASARGQRLQQLAAIGRQNGWMDKQSFLDKASPYIAGAGMAALSGGALGLFSPATGAATSAAPAASVAPAGTISGTGLAGSTGVGALTASTPTVGALTAGGTGTSIAAGGSGAAAAGASPWWVTPAAIAGSSAIGVIGARDAARRQSNAAGDASRMSMEQYQQSRGDLMPWQVTGKAANSSLANYLGIGGGHDSNSGSLLHNFTGADLQNEPGYQFGIQQGERGINNMAGATSGRNSGATMKALLKFNQDYGGTKYNDAFNRDTANKNRTYGYLSGVSGTGENAAGMTAGLGANAAGTAGNFLTQGADASAAGTVGGINAITGGVGQYLNYQSNQSMLDYLKSLRGGIANTGGSAAFGARVQ